MTWGASGGGAERRGLGDIPGQQRIDGVDGVLADSGEDAAQIGLGLKAVHFCGADERVEDRGPLSPGIAACEETVFSAALFEISRRPSAQ